MNNDEINLYYLIFEMYKVLYYNVIIMYTG